MAVAGSVVEGGSRPGVERRMIWGRIYSVCCFWLCWAGFYTLCGRRGKVRREHADVLDKAASGVADGVVVEEGVQVVEILMILLRRIQGKGTTMVIQERKAGDQASGVVLLEGPLLGIWLVIGEGDSRRFPKEMLGGLAEVGIVAVVGVPLLEEIVAQAQVRVERDMKVLALVRRRGGKGLDF